MSDQPPAPALVAAPTTPQSLPAPPTPLSNPAESTEQLATTAGGRSLRKRAATTTSFAEPPSPTDEYHPDYPFPASNGGNDGEGAAGDRTTRSGTAFANRPKWMPKLKLKVNEGADGRRPSFLGPYDRDLDSEEEELVFEEQFILKMPPGKECDKLRELVNKRGMTPDIWFKFKGDAFGAIRCESTHRA